MNGVSIKFTRTTENLIFMFNGGKFYLYLCPDSSVLIPCLYD